jgi:hypothetical protein
VDWMAESRSRPRAAGRGRDRACAVKPCCPDRLSRRLGPQTARRIPRSSARALRNCIPQGQCSGKRRGEAASRSGEAPRQRHEAAAEGLGGKRARFAKGDGGGQADEVVGHDVEGEPGPVGPELARGQVVEAHAVLQVPDGVLDSAAGMTR